ncbi:hypothetical protein ACFQ0G_53785 [Streptomyces chiangmaiensis]
MTTQDIRPRIIDGPDRRPYGWRPPVLTSKQRMEIAQRLTDGEHPKTLALEYGVSARTIRRCAE